VWRTLHAAGAATDIYPDPVCSSFAGVHTVLWKIRAMELLRGRAEDIRPWPLEEPDALIDQMQRAEAVEYRKLPNTMSSISV